jgi:hypothetical protein
MKSIDIKIHSVKTVSVVFCGCETWSVTLSEERSPRVLENKVPRKVCELKRDEVTGDSRKLHDEELHGLCSSPNVIRVIKPRRM